MSEAYQRPLRSMTTELTKFIAHSTTFSQHKQCSLVSLEELYAVMCNSDSHSPLGNAIEADPLPSSLLHCSDEENDQDTLLNMTHKRATSCAFDTTTPMSQSHTSLLLSSSSSHDHRVTMSHPSHASSMTS
uniref:Uncharacterized protein n=1 Tax=Lygus hesperus TaxID=30085 RepID=A0A146M3X5_LYGHE